MVIKRFKLLKLEDVLMLFIVAVISTAIWKFVNPLSGVLLFIVGVYFFIDALRKGYYPK